MIKKIRTELAILAFLVVNVFLSYNLDIGLYNFFSNLNNGIGAIYLKEFFVGITELGDSLWYFLTIFFLFLVPFILVKLSLISIKKYTYLKNFSILSFLYLLLVGLVTQVLKHLFGRPRPNHADFNEYFGLNFFSTDSAFHSFPSGHSSTIVAVVLIAGLLVPSLRIFFYLCGFLIAVSRVVVGAHFVTDVVAGALIAIMFYKIFSSFVEKNKTEFSFKKFEIINISLLAKITIVFLIIAALITVGFKFDVFFSGFFYYGNNQFLLQSYYLISILFRKILIPVVLFYIFVLPVLSNYIPIKKFFFGHKFSTKEIFFIFVSSLTTIIVIINFFLKDLWGRTRPNEILEFGGDSVFAPWYRFGGSCESNCSFVSGDASVGFLLVVFYFITKNNIYCYLAIFFGILFGLVRVVAGGHFFSDIIFSQIVVTGSISFFFILYKRYYDK